MQIPLARKPLKRGRFAAAVLVSQQARLMRKSGICECRFRSRENLKRSRFAAAALSLHNVRDANYALQGTSQ